MTSTAPKHNSVPVQPIDRERGWIWQDGKRVAVPDAPELKTAVMARLHMADLPGEITGPLNYEHLRMNPTD